MRSTIESRYSRRPDARGEWSTPGRRTRCARFVDNGVCQRQIVCPGHLTHVSGSNDDIASPVDKSSHRADHLDVHDRDGATR
jgi:hypothetical protein